MFGRKFSLVITVVLWGAASEHLYPDVLSDDGLVLSAGDFTVATEASPANGQEIYVDGSSTLHLLSQGRLNQVLVAESGRLFMDGGAIYDDDDSAIVGSDSAELVIQSGTVFSEEAFMMELSGSASATVNGGSFSIESSDHSSERFAFRTTDESVLNIRAGDFTELNTLNLFDVYDMSIVNVFGRDLQFSDNQLTGTLTDGNALANTVRLHDEGRILLHNVPEPTVGIMAFMAIAALSGFRRI